MSINHEDEILALMSRHYEACKGVFATSTLKAPPSKQRKEEIRENLQEVSSYDAL